MQDDLDRLPRFLASGAAFLLLLAACTIHYMPRDFAIVLVSWMLLSLSVTMSFGHCVLNEP